MQCNTHHAAHNAHVDTLHRCNRCTAAYVADRTPQQDTQSNTIGHGEQMLHGRNAHHVITHHITRSQQEVEHTATPHKAMQLT
jgi:hypothetical protein